MIRGKTMIGVVDVLKPAANGASENTVLQQLQKGQVGLPLTLFYIYTTPEHSIYLYTRVNESDHTII